MTAPSDIETVTPRLTAAPSGFARAAAAAYVAATLLGVVMRFDLLGMGSGIPFDHLLHAHSHTPYFGWAGLGLAAAGAVTLWVAGIGWAVPIVRGGRGVLVRGRGS